MQVASVTGLDSPNNCPTDFWQTHGRALVSDSGRAIIINRAFAARIAVDAKMSSIFGKLRWLSAAKGRIGEPKFWEKIYHVWKAFQIDARQKLLKTYFFSMQSGFLAASVTAPYLGFFCQNFCETQGYFWQKNSKFFAKLGPISKNSNKRKIWISKKLQITKNYNNLAFFRHFWGIFLNSW